MPVKHTPAPWVHKSFSNCDAVVANGVVVATVGLTANDEIPNDFDMTQQQADAKLIAAAPDLLKFALETEIYFAQHEQETIAKFGLIAARAVIAKATV
jgi:hypothetical protein